MDTLAKATPTFHFNVWFWHIKEQVRELAYKYRVLKRPKCALILHAEREFRALSYVPPELSQEDGPDEWMQKNVVELLTVFSRQGHSGSSAACAAALFDKLVRYAPLLPLLGGDDEWMEVGPEVWQNIRCSHVFKEATRFNGQAYDIQGKVFIDADGVCYTSRDSFVLITFPYTPITEYVHVTE